MADNLNSQGFEITSRFGRDHSGTLSKKYKARMAKEKRSTGEGGQELTERESLLEELIEISEETDLMMENEDAINKQKSEREVMRSQTTSNPRQITSADLFFFLHAPQHPAINHLSFYCIKQIDYISPCVRAYCNRLQNRYII